MFRTLALCLWPLYGWLITQLILDSLDSMVWWCGVCWLCDNSLEGARGEFLSVLQVLDDFGSTIDRGGLFFDPDDFRANKQVW